MDARVKPAHDAEKCGARVPPFRMCPGRSAAELARPRHSRIHFSNSPPSLALRRGKPTLRRPYSLRRRVRRSPLPYPRKCEGMARQVARPLSLLTASPLENAGASRRATQTSLRSLGLFADVLLTAPGRAFRRPSDLWTAPVSQLLAGSPYWPPGGAPAPPECVPCVRHARGRRILLHHQDASR